MASQRYPGRSFSDPSTHFELVTAETSHGNDGLRRGEPTGQVRCDTCGAVHRNVDEIPHDEDCPQRWVKSWFWAGRFLDDGGMAINEEWA